MKIYNITGIGSSLTGSFSGSFIGDGSNITSISSDNISFNFTAISSSAQIASDISGSFNSTSSSLAQRISTNEGSVSSLNAATSSYLLNTTDTLTGDLTVTGKVTAQEFHTEYISSSIVYQSGSTKFGDTSDDTHQFTGSVSITGTSSTDSDIYTKGSLRFNGSGLNATDKKLYSPADGDLEWMTHTSAGEHGFAVSHQGAKKVYLNALGSSYFIGGNVGIGTSSPDGNLHVYQSTTEGSIRIGGGNGVGNSRVFIQSNGASSYIDSYGNDAYQNLGIQTLTLHLNSAANTGNVLIGTTTDSGNKFEIRTSTYNRISSYFSGDYTSGFKFSDLNGGIYYDASADYLNVFTDYINGKIAFSTAGSERVRITNTGNVGIGTTSPFSGAELDVYGDLVLGQQNWAIRGNNANADIGFEELAGSSFSDANYRLYLQSGGNVGIGTTSPSTHLHVSSGTHTKLRVATTGTADASVEILGYDGGVHIGDPINGNRWAIWNDGASTSSSLKIGSYALGTWYADSSQTLTVTYNGEIGIGTTTPTHKVHINSTADNAYALRVQGNTNNVGGVWTGIGIAGESANTKAAILFEDIGSSYSRGKLHLAVNNTQDQSNASVSDARLTVTNDGNVGIGTTSPERKLSVEGSVRVGRATLGWYEAGSNAWDGYVYLHLKTNLDGGGSGNVEYTMSLFRGRYYSYSAEIREGSLGFHNWSGSFYSTVYTGNFFASPYMSSDGKVVLVVNINSGNHLGVTIDWYQAFPYPLRESIVTAVSPSNSSSGVY